MSGGPFRVAAERHLGPRVKSYRASRHWGKWLALPIMPLLTLVAFLVEPHISAEYNGLMLIPMLLGIAATPAFLFGTYSWWNQAVHVHEEGLMVQSSDGKSEMFWDAVAEVGDVTMTDRTGRQLRLPEGLDALSLLRDDIRTRVRAAAGAA